MREGHGRHGQPQRGLLLDFLGQAARTADEQADSARSRNGEPRKIVRELLGRHRLSLDAHRDDRRPRPDLALDERRLAVERLRDFSLGGRLRKPLLGQLDDFELAVAAEPLLVFLDGLRPELFSELADADQPDTKHTVSSSVSTTGASMQSRGATQTVQCSLPCRAFFVC